MTAILENRDFRFREDPGDPWVARMHHVDAFPPGDGRQGVREEDLAGHTPGKDLDLDLPWRMYYGKRVPGFPVHGHRGFETITIVLDGVVDHHDSHGEHGRYGRGDVQWMTAGEGIRHSEMFPLVHDDKENRMELFQIWLSLPSWNKLVPCDYKMLWREEIPVVHGDNTAVQVIAGAWKGQTAPKPIEASWASDAKSRLRILLIDVDAEGTVDIEGVSETLNRNLYFFEGERVQVDGVDLEGKRSLKLKGDANFRIQGLGGPARLLLLEAEPLGEPIINDGPMIMNTMEEILQGYRDYWENNYGDWDWEDRDPVHPKETGRVSSRAENPAGS